MDIRANQPLRGSNLRLDGQNSRLRFGLAGLVVALAISVWLVSAGVDRGWRLLLFFPFFLAATGAWQGLYRTCPGHAAKGVREREHGQTTRVVAPDEVVASRCLARRVLWGSVLTSVCATMLVVVLP